MEVSLWKEDAFKQAEGKTASSKLTSTIYQ